VTHEDGLTGLEAIIFSEFAFQRENVETANQGPTKKQSRRQVLISLCMWGGLVLSYGTGLLFALRYVYPLRGQRRLRTIFLAPAADLPVGESKTYTLPDGNQALVTNTGQEVVALSNTCPHLGCKVHWETRNQRFFCPCHAGVFDSEGVAIASPTAAQRKNLTKFLIRRIGSNLFLEVEEIVTL